MTATDNLLEDHVFIRRLKAVIDKAVELLQTGVSIPLNDISLIADVIEQFVDQFHHFKEESGYFPATENKDHCSEDIRKFMIEHEFGRRIAKRIRMHLEEAKTQSNVNEPLMRYLRTYSVFIQDHTSKEDRFFGTIQSHQSLSRNEEQVLAEKFESVKVEWSNRHANMYEIVEQLENRNWVKLSKQNT